MKNWPVRNVGSAVLMETKGPILAFVLREEVVRTKSSEPTAFNFARPHAEERFPFVEESVVIAQEPLSGIRLHEPVREHSLEILLLLVLTS